MKTHRHFWRNPSFVLFVLWLGAIRPIITPNEVPLSSDFAFHLYRLTALQQLIADGIPFSRWVPQFAQGYGYPIFNFVPPLPYYFALPLTAIVDSFLAIQIVLALGILFGGWSTYRFLTAHVRASAALAGAVAFMYAPYLAYDALHRSNLAETVALTIVPFVLWRLDRQLAASSMRNGLFAAVGYAALILTHNLVTVMATPLLVGYLLLVHGGRGGTRREEKNKGLIKSLLEVGGAFLLAVGLSAFFWMPAILESGSVALERLNPSDEFLVFNNLLSWAEIFSMPRVYPANWINPSPSPALGLLPFLIIAAAIGYQTLDRRAGRMPAPHKSGYFLIATLGVLLLVSPVSAALWQSAEFLAIFQFPWRWLAIGVCVVAVAVGFSAEFLPTKLTPLLALLLIWQAQGWIDLPHIPIFDSHVSNIGEMERATGTIGTTTTGEYVPKTVRFLPEEPTTTQFSGVGISDQQAQTGRWRVRQTAQVSHSAEQIITAQQFAFPGWQATVNGQSVPITPDPQNGLITFPVPAGTHTLQIEFGPTGLRSVAATISLLSLAITLWLGWRNRTQGNPKTGVYPLEPWQAGGLLTIAVVGAAWPALRQPMAADNTLADYGAVRLISAEFPTRQPADQPIAVQLQWATDATPSQILQSTVALQDKQGVLYSEKTSSWPRRFQRAYPSNAWPPSHIVDDRPLVTPFAGVPAGEYDLVLTLFDRDSLQPLAIEGTTTTQLSIGSIWLNSAETPPTIEPRFANPSPNSNAPIQLLGYDIDRTEAAVGEQLLLTLVWQASESLELTPDVTLHQQSEAVASFGPQLPIATTADHSLQTRHLLRVPNVGGLQDGAAQIVVSVFEQAQLAVDLEIRVPERLLTPPPVAQQVDAPLGSVAILHGVTVLEDEGTISAELVWRSAEITAQSYRVFVHLLDENDHILAQSDADPTQWTRPTTGWLPPEYITDTHIVPNPDQPYRLRIGMYQPETGQQLGEPIVLEP